MADSNAGSDVGTTPVDSEYLVVETATDKVLGLALTEEKSEIQDTEKGNADEKERENDMDRKEIYSNGESREDFDYMASLMSRTIYHDKEIVVNPLITELLTSGLVEEFIPSLKKTQATIAQIKDSQQVLLDTVEQENSKFQDCHSISCLESTMAEAKLYHVKLLKLRKEMTALHEKSAKLKRRAVKLQQQKQKEEMNKAQIMEKEYEREKMLTARVATE